MQQQRETGARKLEARPDEVDRDKENLEAAGNRSHGLAQDQNPDVLRQSNGVRQSGGTLPRASSTDTVAMGAGAALARHSRDAVRPEVDSAASGNADREDHDPAEDDGSR